MSDSKSDGVLHEVHAIRSIPLGGTVFGLRPLPLLFTLTPDEQALHVDAFLASMRSSGATQILTRLPETEESEAVREVIAKRGFVFQHRRIEFTAPIAHLPSDDNSPLRWEPMDEGGAWTLARVANFLRTVAQGDPGTDPSEDIETSLHNDLSDPELTRGVDCVHIGFLNGAPAALVIAQVAPSSGWSRITYMGVHPSFRSQGLGVWVHKHGFTMMKEQGGMLYHGGTLEGNIPMLALFRRHGCAEKGRLQEWSLKF